MEKIKEYIESNKDRFLEELFAIIRIPSVSAQDEHKGDMIKAAEHLKQSLLDAGADKTSGHGLDAKGMRRFKGLHKHSL